MRAIKPFLAMSIYSDFKNKSDKHKNTFKKIQVKIYVNVLVLVGVGKERSSMAKKKKKNKAGSPSTRPLDTEISKRSAEAERSRSPPRVLSDDVNDGIDDNTSTNDDVNTTESNFFLLSCKTCGGRRSLCCGQRFTRRLRQPAFLYSYISTFIMFGFLIGAIFGSFLSITLVYYLKMNPEDMSASRATVLDWTTDVISEGWTLLKGETKQCYTGPNGNKPFSERKINIFGKNNSFFLR
jgi:hypothetical protein